MSDYYNSLHYPDPTAYEALKNIKESDERLHRLIRKLKATIDENGFELVERIVLRDKKSGRIYK